MSQNTHSVTKTWHLWLTNLSPGISNELPGLCCRSCLGNGNEALYGIRGSSAVRKGAGRGGICRGYSLCLGTSTGGNTCMHKRVTTREHHIIWVKQLLNLYLSPLCYNISQDTATAESLHQATTFVFYKLSSQASKAPFICFKNQNAYSFIHLHYLSTVIRSKMTGVNHQGQKFLKTLSRVDDRWKQMFSKGLTKGLKHAESREK